ncbi:hypothetical protein LEL_10730 [Akanthomyces lecanii RCEF 1005]|uniref:Uncharacterized protein n=1 Tax=Akanthomyces lecanii RCEF 1005 TaxID=1081108 RepID=A0A167VA89_CORDF|nr:hypothetical protein LEL_10730 [Akanthomyces lecanii RCEF 1005]
MGVFSEQPIFALSLADSIAGVESVSKNKPLSFTIESSTLNDLTPTILLTALRTFAESIAACARKFDDGYAHAVANDFTKSLLSHWNQFLHAGETMGPSSSELPQPRLKPADKSVSGPPTNNKVAHK